VSVAFAGPAIMNAASRALDSEPVSSARRPGHARMRHAADDHGGSQNDPVLNGAHPHHRRAGAACTTAKDSCRRSASGSKGILSGASSASPTTDSDVP
jgi:hypothetical protein